MPGLVSVRHRNSTPSNQKVSMWSASSLRRQYRRHLEHTALRRSFKFKGATYRVRKRTLFSPRCYCVRITVCRERLNTRVKLVCCAMSVALR